MSNSTIPVTIALVLAVASGSAYAKASVRSPAPEEIRRTFNTYELYYVQDPALTAEPRLGIGRVALLRRDASGNCVSNGPVVFVADEVRWKDMVIRQNSAPVVLEAVLVAGGVTAGAGLSIFGSAATSRDALFQILVQDVAHYLLEVDDGARGAMDAFKARHPEYMAADGPCAMYLVKGITHRTFTTKRFYKSNTSAHAGFMSMNVEGQTYQSSESYVTTVAFGLTLHEMYLHPSVKSLAPPQKSPIRARSAPATKKR